MIIIAENLAAYFYFTNPIYDRAITVKKKQNHYGFCLQDNGQPKDCYDLNPNGLLSFKF
jgi:hypothetical protein